MGYSPTLSHSLSPHPAFSQTHRYLVVMLFQEGGHLNDGPLPPFPSKLHLAFPKADVQPQMGSAEIELGKPSLSQSQVCYQRTGSGPGVSRFLTSYLTENQGSHRFAKNSKITYLEQSHSAAQRGTTLSRLTAGHVSMEDSRGPQLLSESSSYGV